MDGDYVSMLQVADNSRLILICRNPGKADIWDLEFRVGKYRRGWLGIRENG